MFYAVLLKRVNRVKRLNSCYSLIHRSSTLILFNNRFEL